MILTYTTRRNLFGSLSNDKSTANLTLGDTLITLAEKSISKKFNFLEDTFSITTVASQQFYDLPIDFGLLKSIYLTIGTTRYFPKIITSKEQFDLINATTSTTSTIPEYAFIFNGQIGFYPTPSTASYTFTLSYHIRYKDLSVADYTTGTITTITNGSDAVVGSGTSWTSAMIGRYFQITEAQGGDGYWYKISAVTDATHLTLDKNYEGTSIAAGSATYTIGQCSLLPEDLQMLPVLEALKIYFTSVKPDNNKMVIYKNEVAELKKMMMENYGSSSISPLCSPDDTKIENINNYIEAV